MPRYRSIADSEDSETLMMVCNKLACTVAVTANYLTGIDQIIKISSQVHEIRGKRYIDPTKLIL